jgi:uncharacterized protein YgiM (DUF1202 family)
MHKKHFVWILLTCLLAACAAPQTETSASAITRLPATSTPTFVHTHTPQPAPTATETATALPSPSPTASATPSPTSTPTHTPTPEGTPLPTPEPGVYAVVGVRLDDVLNVRAGPGVDNASIGAIAPYGTDVQVLEGGVQIRSAVWVQVAYGHVRGWVNSRYLARQVGQATPEIAERAKAIVSALEDKDLPALAALVHPTKGLRFSPYAYVRLDQDVLLTAAEIAALPGSQDVLRWGRYDGTGDPIDLTVDEYWDRFVYDVDFAKPDVVGYNEAIGRGNTIDNHAEAYPEAFMVEHYLSGFDPQFEGLDWRGLRLVLEKVDDTWYLVGLIHDEWTI